MNIVYSNQFKRDTKKMQKHGKNMSKFKVVVELLMEQKEMPKIFCDHPLKGNWNGYRDLHIESDWVLIYKVDLTNNYIRFERMGSHSDLF